MPRLSSKQLPPINIQSQTSVGQRIAQIRKNRSLTQLQLAERIGISRNLIADYENNRIRIYDEMITRLAIALECSTDEILGFQVHATDQTVSLRLMKRISEIDKLPEAKKKAILKTLDDLIRANS